jgi:hypothetical protein
MHALNRLWKYGKGSTMCTVHWPIALHWPSDCGLFIDTVHCTMHRQQKILKTLGASTLRQTEPLCARSSLLTQQHVFQQHAKLAAC